MSSVIISYFFLSDGWCISGLLRASVGIRGALNHPESPYYIDFTDRLFLRYDTRCPNKVKNKKNYKVKKTDILRSISLRRIRGVSPEEEKKCYSGKDLQKREVWSLEWKSEAFEIMHILNDSSSAFLWRYEPVRRTGKSDDWLRIFLLA